MILLVDTSRVSTRKFLPIRLPIRPALLQHFSATHEPPKAISILPLHHYTSSISLSGFCDELSTCTHRHTFRMVVSNGENSVHWTATNRVLTRYDSPLEISRFAHGSTRSHAQTAGNAVLFRAVNEAELTASGYT